MNKLVNVSNSLVDSCLEGLGFDTTLISFFVTIVPFSREKYLHCEVQMQYAQDNQIH